MVLDGFPAVLLTETEQEHPVEDAENASGRKSKGQRVRSRITAAGATAFLSHVSIWSESI